MKSRIRILPGFLIVVITGFALYMMMVSLQTKLLAHPILFDYDTLQKQAVSNVQWRLLWLIGDTTEAQFYKSVFAGIGLLTFALIAHVLDRWRLRWAGFPIAYGTGLWLWIFFASMVGLFVSVFLYGGQLSHGWVPTFVPFVSVPAGVVLIYGRGWKTAVTGGILGGLFTFPISWFLIEKILNPLGYPSVIGNVTGMWLGAILVFEICRYLPWMSPGQVTPIESSADNGGNSEITQQEIATTIETPETGQLKKDLGSMWFVRRVLADFTEAPFYANELASIGLILGAILSWVLNPLNPAYGSGVFPAILLSQILTAAIGIFLYYDLWKKLGWYPTFVPLVSVAPAVVLTFNGSMTSIIAGALLGALAGPPFAQCIIRILPKHYHGFIGNTLSMAVCTWVIISMLKYVQGL
ncbi:hypothetical protein ACFO25_13880 [Paenactinomyces guangxiensis]|uniref:Uncharacterized protein n=1 Tax=Paenactinomyces guangxiensis TaxID=1490290 RepID=A0A7W2A880_9BACL|nr:hypothetical protein [Paenactinomyces guangxiensis]MBA4493533.1 hypothetical protein [Paenactinomyces guangxiensis]MBH8590624.1 hypothetical protein [Paenactinomyces guangxiensis]